MVNELLQYVEEQLKKGYKPDVVRDTLIRDGYSPGLVDGVMDSVLKKRLTTSPEFAGSTPVRSGFPKIVFIILFLIIVVLGVIFIPNMIKKDALLDIVATPDKNSYEQGENLGFEVEIFNMGSADRFDIALDYRLLDDNDNKILGREKTIAISTSTSHYESIELSDTITPGHYTLKVFANYEEKIAVSSFSFNVNEKSAVVVKETCYDNKQNQDETGPDCGGVCGGYWYDNSCHPKPKDPTTTEETCSDGVKNQNEHHTDCGGVCKSANGDYWYDNSCHTQPEEDEPEVGPTPLQKILEAQGEAETNPAKAKSICAGIEEAEAKDKCFQRIAPIINDPKICEDVVDVGIRDNCYYPFFMQGDYSVCEKLTESNSRAACEQLRDLSQLSGS